MADRIEHLFRVRDLQARTGGFTAFICWPLQPENTEMEGTPKTDSHTYLRTVAIARLVLDNVPNLQASWVTMGLKVGQIALQFGCNDFGSLMIEENVVSAAGTANRATLDEMRGVHRGCRVQTGETETGLLDHQRRGGGVGWPERSRS